MRRNRKREARKSMERKAVAFTQAFILILATVSFAYFIGAEFKLVSADCLDPNYVEMYPGECADYAPQENQGGITVVGGLTAVGGAASVARVVKGAASGGGTVPADISNVQGTQGKPLLSRLFGGVKTSFSAQHGSESLSWSGSLQSVAWAAAIYYGVRWLAQSLGADQATTNAVAAGAAGAYVGYSFGSAIANALGHGIKGGMVTAAIAIIAASIGYLGSNEAKIELVSVSCNVWQAPKVRNECEKCNIGDFPCTEYKCRSLGQGCEIVNKGESDSICAFVSRVDVDPPVIRPWKEVLTDGYSYTPNNVAAPGDIGVKIIPKGNENGCIKPYEQLQFGVTLDEPGRCKISDEIKSDFKSMDEYLSSGQTKYNHSYRLSALPAPEGFSIVNGGKMNFYIRCEDTPKGNVNVGNFVVSFCVDQGPDKKQPNVVGTDGILNGAPIAYGTQSQKVDFLIDEPSTCRWSYNDQTYDDMPAETQCQTGGITEFNAQMLYTCSMTLNGLRDRAENKFYVRCKDQPQLESTKPLDRNVMAESYLFTLMGTQPLAISEIEPNGTKISDSTNVIKVTLKAKTMAGYKDGEATCSYKNSATTTGFVDFIDSGGKNEHSQDVYLPAGNYTFNISCMDLGGNVDTKESKFTVETDLVAPSVVRVFRQDNSLKVITNERAMCVYSNVDCNYLFDDGTKMSLINATNGTSIEHSTAWNTNKNYYIKCQDRFKNQPLSPAECSIIAKPFEVAKKA